MVMMMMIVEVQRTVAFYCCFYVLVVDCGSKYGRWLAIISYYAFLSWLRQFCGSNLLL
jgi:hypothetical protein